MITAFSRGHKLIYNNEALQWHYFDDKSIFDNSRPCKKCEKMPTKDDHDACLGQLAGVANACCGHGVKGEKYIQKQEQHVAAVIME